MTPDAPRHREINRDGIISETTKIRTTLYILLFCLLAACSPLEESQYSNCVIARSEADFIGSKLKHTADARRSTMLTRECIEEDLKIDDGNGSDLGRVRWVVCYVGPDCDEAGMF